MEITTDLVRRLVSAQFPQWADLPIRPVTLSGWDNRTFHLGPDMSVRLPSAAWYVAQVRKEHTWLPQLASHLSLPIPVPLAMGQPGEGYPWPWSVYRWIHGEPAALAQVADFNQFALRLAGFLQELQRIDASGGPAAGEHNFYRGGPLRVYDDETRFTLQRLDGLVDCATSAQVWEQALASTWQPPPVWVHGDVAAGNLLVQDGRLSAVIDFGSSGVGDPACDLVITWTFLRGESRAAFRTAMAPDAATWARARGWALWKALITLDKALDGQPAEAESARAVIDAVIADYRQDRDG